MPVIYIYLIRYYSHVELIDYTLLWVEWIIYRKRFCSILFNNSWLHSWICFGKLNELTALTLYCPLYYIFMTMVINSASRLKMTMAAHIRKKRWISTHIMCRTMLMVKHWSWLLQLWWLWRQWRRRLQWHWWFWSRVAAFAERRADQQDLLGQTRS